LCDARYPEVKRYARGERTCNLSQATLGYESGDTHSDFAQDHMLTCREIVTDPELAVPASGSTTVTPEPSSINAKRSFICPLTNVVRISCETCVVTRLSSLRRGPENDSEELTFAKSLQVTIVVPWLRAPRRARYRIFLILSGARKLEGRSTKRNQSAHSFSFHCQMGKGRH
jgi:hypothetical protein